MREEEVVEVVCNIEPGEDLGGETDRGMKKQNVFQPGLCGPGGSSTARLDLEVIDRQH